MEHLDRRRFIAATGAAALAAGLPPLSFARAGGRRFTILPAGSAKAGGWIERTIAADLRRGIVGRYDRINPTVSHELFVNQNAESLPGAFISARKPWWSGEHEGYWKDAVVRSSWLAGDEEYIGRSREWMASIVRARPKSGYIGIYAPGNRYSHKRENGELWVQGRMFVAMLAHAEQSGDREVFEAVEKAVRLSIREYGKGRGYFEQAGWTTHSGGLSHGLAFCDALEWLHRATGDGDCLAFAEALYRDFDNCSFNNDMSLKKLGRPGGRFKLHGPHIAEHFMIPFFLAGETGKEEFITASDRAMERLMLHLTPGGGLVSSENVHGRPGAANLFHEYCCATELLISLNRLAQYSRSAEAFDLAEKSVFNAAMGARPPLLDSCAYLSRDDRLDIDPLGHGGREIYSPSHDAAACCTLNAGRLLPYYVEGMWMAADGGLAACLYGASEVEAEIKGGRVRVVERSDYPFSDEAVFTVGPERPFEFSLYLRRPGFGGNMSVAAPEGTIKRERDGFIELRRTWSAGDEVRVDFGFEVRAEPVLAEWSRFKRTDGVVFQRGPLLFSLPFPADVEEGKRRGDSDFHDKVVRLRDGEGRDWRAPADAGFEVVRSSLDDGASPWAEPNIKLEGELMDEAGKARKAILVPEGATLLRKTAFPLA